MARVKNDAAKQLLQDALSPGIAAGASDWQFCEDEPVSVRVGGDMAVIPGSSPLAAGRILGLAAAALGLDDAPPPGHDASFSSGGHIFRFHSYTAGGGRYCFSLRRLAGTLPELEQLGAPSAFARALLGASRGLILVTGPTGSGKSTTLAAAVHRLNRERAALILTLEDPIEFRHARGRSIVRQLEKGADFADYGAALHGALRADPDVLLLGEMRDRETIGAALAAAETGHLVLATLHAASAGEAVARITGAFDAAGAAEIRTQLAQQLVGVLAQQLLRSAAGPPVAAYELLLATPGVRRLIADPERRSALLANEIATGRSQGMIAMQQSLEELCRRGTITRAEAMRAGLTPSDWARCA